MFHNDGSRAFGKKFQYIKRIIYVSEIDLAGVLAGLNHIRFVY